MTIYTFGYSGRTVAELVALADRLDAIVVDVRYSPRSRVAAWAGGPLRRALGDRYRHVPAFGNVNYKSNGPIVLADPEAGIAAVAPLAVERSVVLLCACRHAAECHRTTAAELLAARLGLPVVHLGAEPPAQHELFA